MTKGKQFAHAFYRSVGSVRVDLAGTIDLTSEGDVIITRYGKPVAVLLSYEDYALFVGTLEEVREEATSEVSS